MHIHTVLLTIVCVAVNHHQAYSSFRATERFPSENNNNNNNDDDHGYGRPPQYLKVSDVSLFSTGSYHNSNPTITPYYPRSLMF